MTALDNHTNIPGCMDLPTDRMSNIYTLANLDPQLLLLIFFPDLESLGNITPPLFNVHFVV